MGRYKEKVFNETRGIDPVDDYKINPNYVSDSLGISKNRNQKPKLAPSSYIKKTHDPIHYQNDTGALNRRRSRALVSGGVLYYVTHEGSDPYYAEFYKIEADGTETHIGRIGTIAIAGELYGLYLMGERIVCIGNFDGVSTNGRYTDDLGENWSDLPQDNIGSEVLTDGNAYYVIEYWDGDASPPQEGYVKIYEADSQGTPGDLLLDYSVPPLAQFRSPIEFDGDIYFLLAGQNFTHIMRYDSLNKRVTSFKDISDSVLDYTTGISDNYPADLMANWNGKMTVFYADDDILYLLVFDGEKWQYKRLSEKFLDTPTIADWNSEFLLFTDRTEYTNYFHIIYSDYTCFKKYLDFTLIEDEAGDWEKHSWRLLNGRLYVFYDDWGAYPNLESSSMKIVAQGTSQQATGTYYLPEIKGENIIPKQVILYHNKYSGGAKIEVYYREYGSYTKLGEITDTGSEGTRDVLNFNDGLLYGRIKFKIVITQGTGTNPEDIILKFIYNTKGLD